jgi:hypothetical protein
MRELGEARAAHLLRAALAIGCIEDSSWLSAPVRLLPMRASHVRRESILQVMLFAHA